MIPRARQSKALSLVETVVLAGVVSLIVIFTLGMIPSFKMSNRRAAMELQAGQLAQATLEQLRAKPFDEVEGTAFDDVTVDGITYQRQVQVSNPVLAGTPPQKIAHTVRVVVRWSWSERDYQTFRETGLCKLLRS